MSGRVLTGALGQFTALHYSPDGDDLHEHTWHVAARFDTRGRPDARVYRAMLENILDHWNGSTMPRELSWAEDMAVAVGKLVNCVEVDVWRDDERLTAHWRAS